MPTPLPPSTRRTPRSRIPGGLGPLYVGREAIRAQFASVLTSPRCTELLRVGIVGNEVALLFRATSGDGTSTEVFDVMSFDTQKETIAGSIFGVLQLRSLGYA